VGWDNSPRRGRHGIILLNGGPEHFERSLAEAAARAQRFVEEEQLIFVNAWNEWAEGNHLEPDQRHGRAYLEAVRGVLNGAVSHSEVLR
jgi:hypothetical protein